MAVLWLGAGASAVIDNIPFVAAAIPVISSAIPEIAQAQGLKDPGEIEMLVARPLWWALSLGACLGGNATLVGASANVVMAGFARRNRVEFSFGRFLAYGLPAAGASLVIATGYVYLRYVR